MRRVALVFAGGFCGTLARYLLSAPLLAVAQLALPGGAAFPYDILAINLTGALALGLLYGLVERGSRVSPDVRLTLGTGFLGAYTTFSSFVVGGDKLILGGDVAAGMMYLVGSIVLGVAAAHAGYLLSGVVSGHARISPRARRAMRGRQELFQWLGPRVGIPGFSLRRGRGLPERALREPQRATYSGEMSGLATGERSLPQGEQWIETTDTADTPGRP